MARIADELTFSLERVLQPLQKVVECCSKIPDFVSSQWQWQTGMWVGGADARGADAHAFHGSKSRGGQQIRAQGVDEDVWPCPDRCLAPARLPSRCCGRGLRARSASPPGPVF